jgi:hypothetical protein
MLLKRFMLAMSLAAGMSLLAGCGTVAGMNGVSASASTNLNGNWLLFGTLPTVGSITVPSSTGMTATFDVIGTNAVATITMAIPCTIGFSTTTQSLVSGAIAVDGSFTLQSPSTTSGNTLAIQGHVPAMVGGAWTGTYTGTLNGCGTFSGQVAATAIPFVAGTFAGSTTLSQFLSPPQPITVRANLQQGGYLAGGSTFNNGVLGGTIAITGSPCLTSGTTTGSPSAGAVEGNTVLAIFTMNDGSTLEMLGSISSMDSTKLQVSFLTTAAGTCNNALTVSPSTILIKQ